MMRLRTVSVVFLASAVWVGCGDDSPTDPGTTLSLNIVSGNNQVGAIGAPLPAPLIVEVEDQNGDPVGAASVSWVLAAAAGPNASLSSSSTETGTDGRTSVSFSLGDAAGTYEVRASVTGSSVTFTAEASASGALEVVSGSGQVGLTGSTLGDSLVVRAVGPGSTRLEGVEVTFDIAQTNGSGAAVSPLVVATDANGEAFTRLTLGDRNGLTRVTATANGTVQEFSAYACGGDGTATTLDLEPGQGATFGSGDVGCIQLPAPTQDGVAYEVVVTTVPQTLGTSNMVLAIAGTAPQALPQPLVAGRRGPLFAPQDPGGVSSSALQMEWDRRMRRLESGMLPTIKAAAKSGGFGLMSVPTVGEQRTIKFSCVGFGGDGTFPDAPEELTVEAIVVSDRAVIWEDIQNPGAFDPTQYGEIAGTFDDLIYAVDTTYFGAPGDIDGDGRVSLVYSSEVNRMTNALSGTYTAGYIAGFFCPRDLGSAGYNNSEMFYLVIPDPTGAYVDDDSGLSVFQVRSQTDKTVAHEFQHMINAQTGTGSAQAIWINEGLSHLAEEVVGHATGGFLPGADLSFATVAGTEAYTNYYLDNFYNLSVYLSAPADTGGLILWNDPLTQNTFPMRGAAWAFLRYTLDRFENPASEWQATRALLRSTAGCGGADLACLDTSARVAIEDRFGTFFPNLVAEWNAMLAVEDRTDLGGPLDARFDLPSWRLRSFFTNYPLEGLSATIRAALGVQGRVDAELYTARTRFVRLSGDSGSGVSGLRLMEGGSGADLSAGVVPRLTIVRTN